MNRDTAADYPTDVTAEERAAGFALVKIDDPRRPEGATPGEIEAVVCAIDTANRVVKRIAGWPFGQPGTGIPVYIHQRFGRPCSDEPGSRERWVTVFNPAETAAGGVRIAQLNRDSFDATVPMN